MNPRGHLRRPSGRAARRALAAEAAVVGLAAGYRVFVQDRVPERLRVPANVAAGGVALAVAAAGGADAADLGLSPAAVAGGLAVGVAAFGVMSAITAGLVALPTTRPLFADPMAKDVHARHVAYESAVRIPLGTALFEEALFRGALYGLHRHWLPRAWVVPWNSLLFGLWHITEGIRQHRDPELHAQFDFGPAPSIVGAVLATGAGGTVLCAQRELAGSLVAPVLGHSGSNVSAYLGAVAAVHLFGAEPPAVEAGSEPEAEGGES